MKENLPLICPKTHQQLYLSNNHRFYHTADGSKQYPIEDGVVRFLEKTDEFYEGAYMATVKWLPKSEKWYHRWPLFLVSSGYILAVRNELKAGSTILEIGCGGGIAYFNLRYNVIGLDLSFTSLQNAPYEFKIQGDAINTPLPSNSIDAIVSCSFWEHIPEENKVLMLKEFKRLLKEKGKIIFFYDVESENKLINKLKLKNFDLYQQIFINHDGHLGYQTPHKNREIFESCGFSIKKHFGKERTNLLALSAISKLGECGVINTVSYLLYKPFFKSPLIHVYNAVLWVIDNTIGYLYSEKRARVILTVAEKK